MGKLFGTDGIRGVAGEYPLTPDFVARLGRVAGHVLGKHSGARKRVVMVVRDTRASGASLQRSLTQGLAAAGMGVADGGVLPTPAVAALVPRKKFAAGAVISASHNPAEFNGIKFFGPEGTKLSEALEQAVEAGLLAEAEPPASKKKGKAEKFASAGRDYLAFLRSTWPKGLSLKGFKIAVDCANGATGPVAASLFRSLGATVIVQSARPNGLNINKGCGALHPEALARVVKREGAHLGAAFDGDGDRAIFVDEEGVVRDGDYVLLAAGRHLKERGRLKKNLVVVTVMANLGLRRALASLGIDLLETAVGDKYVWQGLEKTGAVLGGEQSGHIIFREFLPSGDGLLTALQMLAVLKESGRPLSALSSLVVRYPQVLVNVKMKERTPLEDVGAYQAALKKVQAELGTAGRVLVRYSGTEPLLRIMVEGPDMPSIQAHAEALAAAVRRAGA